jgi:drug/metabolite transporter (DMT)-like permease
MNERIKAPVHPYIAIGTGIFFISTGAILVRAIEAPPLVIAFYRVFLASIILFLLKPREFISTLKTAGTKNYLVAGIAGGFLALHFGVWIASLNYTTVANSVVLVDSAPLIAVVLSHFILKERGTIIILGGIMLATVGAVVISWGDLSANPAYFTGDILAIIGAFAEAAYLVSSKIVRTNMPFVPFLILVYGYSALFLVISCIVTGDHLWGYSFGVYVLFFGLAIIPTIGGHSFFLYALRYMKAFLVNLGFLGEPIGAAFLAYIFFREVPSLFFYAGGSLIIIGSLIAILKEEWGKKTADS